jgi:hypothetical protein
VTLNALEWSRDLKVLHCLAGCALLVGAACAVDWYVPDHTATYVDPIGNSITVELYLAHPYSPPYNEYYRTLRVAGQGSLRGKFELFMDTGGYTAANLWSCGGSRYLLESYFEQVYVDAATCVIANGKCAGAMKYLGIFDGNSRSPWQFHSADQRPYRKLEPRGG